MNFPYNNTTPRRRFSSNNYKRVLPNGESVSRSWLVYSGESDQVFCFYCKLFGKTLSPFCSGINTWEGFSKKLKDHENGISHQECCSQWMLLAEGIRNSSTIDKREMNIFFDERRFWRNFLERLIDIALFLSERNLAFRGSEEVLGSPHNGNFLGIFELLAKIKCIKPLRYNLKEVLLALKDLEAISIERKDGRAASETKSLIAHLSKWSFLLSVFIWYDILFQVNKASKILQSYGVSLHTMETEIQATEKFLQNYRTTGYDSAATSAVEIAQELDIDPSFPPSRSGKKRRLFDYQGEEEQRATPELKFKSNFFYPLVDQAIMSIKERFNLLREVSSAFSFLYTRDKLLLVQQENALLTCCKEFQKKFGDIDSDDMSAELQRFVLILHKKRNLKTAQDFLNYLLKTHLFELYPNVYIALRILLTCPVTVASAERSFSKLKLIKTFNRTSMTDSRLSSLAMLSIENDCARSLDYDNVITAFANKKVRSRLFK